MSTIWERAAAAHAIAVSAVGEHLDSCERCRPNAGVRPECVQLWHLVDRMFAAPKFPTGPEVIAAGECPVGARGPMACFFCTYGHMLECPYPKTCEQAHCSHLRGDAA